MEQISVSFSWLSAGFKLSKLLVLKVLIAQEKDIIRKLEKMGHSKDGTELSEQAQGAILSDRD